MAMPVAITVEGANIMTRSFQIIGQGLTRCHPHMLPLIDSLQSTDADAPAKFRTQFGKMLGHVFSNLGLGLMRGVGSTVSTATRSATAYKDGDKLISLSLSRSSSLSLSNSLSLSLSLSLALLLGGRLKFSLSLLTGPPRRRDGRYLPRLLDPPPLLAQPRRRPRPRGPRRVRPPPGASHTDTRGPCVPTPPCANLLSSCRPTSHFAE